MKTRSANYKLSDSKLWQKISRDFGDGGGIYELYCMLPKTEIVAIQRMHKTDAMGTLYIGWAKRFRDGVIELKKSMALHDSSSNHEGGVRYRDSKILQEKYPYEHLYVELQSTDRNVDMESEKLKSYIGEFGELPPLNSTF